MRNIACARKGAQSLETIYGPVSGRPNLMCSEAAIRLPSKDRIAVAREIDAESLDM